MQSLDPPCLSFSLISVILTCLSVSAFSQSSISYALHCNATVPESPSSGEKFVCPYQFLSLQNAYFVGGNPIFEENPNSNDDRSSRSLSLRSAICRRTLSNAITEIEGNLILRNPKLLTFPSGNYTVRRGLRYQVTPRFPVRRGLVSFRLRGFWSSISGDLCMIGSGSTYAKDGKLRSFSAVLKLNYRNSSCILTSLVTGNLESVDANNSLNYFDPVSILGLSLMNYNYTLIGEQHEVSGFSQFDRYENDSLGLATRTDACTLLNGFTHAFKLDYLSECNAVTCNSFDRGSDNVPSFMSIQRISCLEGKLRALIGFSSYGYYGHSLPFDPNKTLVAEGVWDLEKNRMCFIACRIFNFTSSLADTSLGDCTIRLCFRFPATLSLKKRSSVVGEMWSNASSSDFDYNHRIKFQDLGKSSLYLPGLKYEYSEINRARSFCKKRKTEEHKVKTYPDGNSVDMKLDMSVTSSAGKKGFGRIIPLSVGNRLYTHSLLPVSIENQSAAPSSSNPGRLLNISYKINLLPSVGFRSVDRNYSIEPFDISAEGTYNTDTGVLCMVGCRHLHMNETSVKTDAVDCEIHITIQFSSLNDMDGTSMEGSIESNREMTDDLYFKPYFLSSNSFYSNQAAESVWRMDLEIIMVVGSNTLACIFLGMQLFYVKGNLDAVPFISIVMLLMLVMGHMMPLVLNFGTIFPTGPLRRSSFVGDRGGVQVNDVVVGGVTLVPFVLLCRLLYVTWASRRHVDKKGLWFSEKKVLFLSLQLYVTFGLVGWFVYHGKNESYDRHVFWGFLRSYTGFASDNFLLPQILFNMVVKSSDRVLLPAFYMGITFLHLLPHIYDLYRMLGFSSSLNFSYIYANPKIDLYSFLSDIMILCLGMLFMIIIYVQQRYGGQAILPKRYRESSIYEQVPGITTE